MWAVVEYHYKNATTYERRQHYHRKVSITSLTRYGAEKWFANDLDLHREEKRFREGERWFSYRTMWIVEVRLECFSLQEID